MNHCKTFNKLNKLLQNNKQNKLQSNFEKPTIYLGRVHCDRPKFGIIRQFVVPSRTELCNQNLEAYQATSQSWTKTNATQSLYQDQEETQTNAIGE